MSKEQDQEALDKQSGSVRPVYTATLTRVAQVLVPLSISLDLGSGAAEGHTLRSCTIGMHLATELKLSEKLQDNLFHALLLKDAGYTISADNEVSPEVFRARCERGAALARLMRLDEETAAGIAAIRDRWDGEGLEQESSGEGIPIIARIILAAQTLDTFGSAFGTEAALRVLSSNSGIWFDPEVVRAAHSLASRQELVASASGAEALAAVLSLESQPLTFSEGRVTLNSIFEGFAAIVDAKSSFRYLHSQSVADVATAVAAKLGLSPARIETLRHAALLHDIGKMAVPNEILLKSAELTAEEWQIVRTHPERTFHILDGIPGLAEVRDIAAAHHERMDGSGYPRGLRADQISMEARILALADVFDALQSRRPYRDGMPREIVTKIIRSKTPALYDADCVAALETADLPMPQEAPGLDAGTGSRSARAGSSS